MNIIHKIGNVTAKESWIYRSRSSVLPRLWRNGDRWPIPLKNMGTLVTFLGSLILLPFRNLKFVGTWAPTTKIFGDIADFNVLNVPKTQPRYNPEGQMSLCATHPLMLIIICAKYGKNSSRTVCAIEQTQMCHILAVVLWNHGWMTLML